MSRAEHHRAHFEVLNSGLDGETEYCSIDFSAVGKAYRRLCCNIGEHPICWKIDEEHK